MQQDQIRQSTFERNLAAQHELTSATKSPSLEKLDTLGTFLSSACAVHCIATPFVLTALPFLGLSFLAHGAFDLIMISVAVTLACLSLCWGHRQHGSYKTFLFVVAALSFFGLGHLFEESSAHAMFMALGGVSLASGHLLNRKLCRSCHNCCADH